MLRVVGEEVGPYLKELTLGGSDASGLSGLQRNRKKKEKHGGNSANRVHSAKNSKKTVNVGENCFWPSVSQRKEKTPPREQPLPQYQKYFPMSFWTRPIPDPATAHT